RHFVTSRRHMGLQGVEHPKRTNLGSFLRHGLKRRHHCIERLVNPFKIAIRYSRLFPSPPPRLTQNALGLLVGYWLAQDGQKNLHFIKEFRFSPIADSLG